MTNEEALQYYLKQLDKTKSEYRKRDILRACAKLRRKMKLEKRLAESK